MFSSENVSLSFLHHTLYTIHARIARLRAFLKYKYIIMRARVHAPFLCFITYLCPFYAKKSQKSVIFISLKINELQRKCKKSAFFLQKYLVNSKKSSTFALAFEKQVCFDFLPEARTLKIRIFHEGPNFFAPNRRQKQLKD